LPGITRWRNKGLMFVLFIWYKNTLTDKGPFYLHDLEGKQNIRTSFSS
jgi:hypothetical protein